MAFAPAPGIYVSPLRGSDGRDDSDKDEEAEQAGSNINTKEVRSPDFHSFPKLTNASLFVSEFRTTGILKHVITQA